MKRMTSMLLAMLMLFACVPAFAVEPTPTPEVHILTTSEETQKAVDRYQANVNYALETFGFDDSVAYPYLPTHIDPVCYRGYLSLVSGYKDGDCYAAYGGWSEEEVQDYLNFFTYLGYDCAERACDLPGVREWHCANPTPREDGKGLLENVKVFYAAEHEMLVIAYPECAGDAKERKPKAKNHRRHRGGTHGKKGGRKGSSKIEEKGSSASAPTANSREG